MSLRGAPLFRGSWMAHVHDPTSDAYRYLPMSSGGRDLGSEAARRDDDDELEECERIRASAAAACEAQLAAHLEGWWAEAAARRDTARAGGGGAGDAFEGYEEWIAACHPENVARSAGAADAARADRRLYLEG